MLLVRAAPNDSITQMSINPDINMAKIPHTQISGPTFSPAGLLFEEADILHKVKFVKFEKTEYP